MKQRFFVLLFCLFSIISLSTAAAEEKLLQVGELKLWTETFGDKTNPAVLMIMGAGSPGYAWPDELCEQIAKEGYFVIRYDHRDVGRSTHIDYSTTPYTLNELTDDALCVLKHYKISKAHVVGASMGGMIAQVMAIQYPEIVLSLTSIMSTADHTPITCRVFRKAGHFSLPPPQEKVLKRILESHQEPGDTPEQRISRAVKNYRVLSSDEEFDQEYWENLEKKCQKLFPPAGTTINHWFAVDNSEARQDKLCQIRARTLVIHGQDDPLIPVEHGKATAEAIPNAKLVVIPKMGHVISIKNLPALKKAIMENIKPYTNSSLKTGE